MRNLISRVYTTQKDEQAKSRSENLGVPTHPSSIHRFGIKNIFGMMMEKTIGFFCAFLGLATNQAYGACEYKEASVKELVQSLDSILYCSDIKDKADKDQIWLIDINGVGLYYCLAHRAESCSNKSSSHYLHADEIEYIAFGGNRMHVTKILDKIQDEALTEELLRAKTPDSYHRTVRKIAWKMKGLGTKTPYPVILIKSKKRRSSHSKN